MNEILDKKLCDAVSSREIVKIENLIFKGANINGIIGEYDEDNDGEIRTVFTAVFDGFELDSKEQFKFIDWLISQGASLIVPNNLNEVPLYFPVYSLDFLLVKGLLDRGANPNNWCVNPFGFHTALDVLYGKWDTLYQKQEVAEAKKMEELLIKHGGKRYFELVPAGDAET